MSESPSPRVALPAPTQLSGYLPSAVIASGGALVDDAIRLSWDGDGAGLSYDSWQFADLDFALFDADRAVDVVPARARSHWPGLMVGMCLSGEVRVTQTERMARVAAGELTFYRGGRPYRISAEGPHSWLVCRLQFLRTGAAAGEVDHMLAVSVPTDGTAAGLLAGVLRGASQARTTLSLRGQMHCADAIHSLVRAVLEDSAARPRGAVSAFHRYTQWLEQNISSGAASAEGIAAAHHVSVRHVRGVFAANGTTATEYLRQRRLERLRQDLLDPTLGMMTVMSLARRWGLANAAAANRWFRLQYGHPPARYRRMNMHLTPA